MIEDLGGEVTRLINFMEFDKDKTSIVCNLVIEDLWGVRIWRNEDLGGVRILEEWGSWRSEDLGGVKILEEWGRDWQKWGVWQWKTSIVCALEEWGSWRSEYLWGVKILEEQVRDWRTRGVYKRQTCIICCLNDWGSWRIGWLSILEEPGRDWMTEDVWEIHMIIFATLWLSILEGWRSGRSIAIWDWIVMGSWGIHTGIVCYLMSIFSILKDWPRWS